MTQLALVGLLCVGLCTAAKKNRCPFDVSSCSECIASGKGCAWCSAEDYADVRCQSLKSSTSTCPKANIVYPHQVIRKLVKEKKVKGNRLISPQKLHLSMRKGASARIPVQVLAKQSSLSLQLRAPKVVKVMVSSECNGFQQRKRFVRCSGLQPGVVNFTVTLKMKKCLPKAKRLKLTVIGKRKKKSLKMTLTSECSCDCDKPEMVAPASPACNGAGNLTCGACSCERGRHGARCECHEDAVFSDMDHPCISKEGHVACSGRGECLCGVCHCYMSLSNNQQRYTGQYCQCDDYSCPYSGNQMCGGEQQGVCRCGKCECKPGFSGDSCGSNRNNDNCRTSSGELCNGKGHCRNNRCVCAPGSGYHGPTCEDCPTCPEQCQRLKSCVQCTVYQSGPYNSSQCTQHCGYVQSRLVLVDDVSIRDRTEVGHSRCMFPDSDGCFFMFGYRHGRDGRLSVLAQQEKMCP